MRARDAVIDVSPAGKVLPRSFASYSPADLFALTLKMQAVAHAIQNGFWMAEGRLKLLSATSLTPVGVVYETARAMLAKLMPSYAMQLPVGAAPSEVIKNVRNALTTLQRGFEERVLPAIDRVKAGELEPERWFAMAKPYADGIKSILDEVNESSGAALVSATIDDLVRDAKRIGKTIDSMVPRLEYWPYIIGGFAVLLGLSYVAQIFGPVRRLSGYTPARRRRRVRRLLP